MFLKWDKVHRLRSIILIQKDAEGVSKTPKTVFRTRVAEQLLISVLKGTRGSLNHHQCDLDRIKVSGLVASSNSAYSPATA